MDVTSLLVYANVRISKEHDSMYPYVGRHGEYVSGDEGSLRHHDKRLFRRRWGPGGRHPHLREGLEGDAADFLCSYSRLLLILVVSVHPACQEGKCRIANSGHWIWFGDSLSHPGVPIYCWMSDAEADDCHCLSTASVEIIGLYQLSHSLVAKVIAVPAARYILFCQIT